MESEKLKTNNQKPTTENMKTVVFYENAADATMERLMEVFPRHDAKQKEFADAGKILGIGPFAVPGEGAMGIFTDRESAEQFVKEDPFLLEGLIAKVTIKEWYDEMM